MLILYEYNMIKQNFPNLKFRPITLTGQYSVYTVCTLYNLHKHIIYREYAHKLQTCIPIIKPLHQLSLTHNRQAKTHIHHISNTIRAHYIIHVFVCVCKLMYTRVKDINSQTSNSNTETKPIHTHIFVLIGFRILSFKWKCPLCSR